jgi:hypothetical protein
MLGHVSVAQVMHPPSEPCGSCPYAIYKEVGNIGLGGLGTAAFHGHQIITLNIISGSLIRSTAVDGRMDCQLQVTENML